MSKAKNPIITRIDNLVNEIPGWSPVDELYTLFSLAYLTADLEGDIVEIGSWCGRSAVVLGLAARLTEKTRVHCVDLFPKKDDWHQNKDGSYSLTVQINGVIYTAYQEHTVWPEPFHRDILPLYETHNRTFDIFTEVIRKHQLQDFVVAHMGDSTRFVSSIPANFKCKLAFVDGDHSYDAVCRDIQNLDKLLVGGGWICFDDAFSTFDGVNRAIEDCIMNNPCYELGQQMTRKFFIAKKKDRSLI